MSLGVFALELKEAVVHLLLFKKNNWDLTVLDNKDAAITNIFVLEQLCIIDDTSEVIGSHHLVISTEAAIRNVIPWGPMRNFRNPQLGNPTFHTPKSFLPGFSKH